MLQISVEQYLPVFRADQVHLHSVLMSFALWGIQRQMKYIATSIMYVVVTQTNGLLVMNKTVISLIRSGLILKFMPNSNAVL